MHRAMFHSFVIAATMLAGTSATAAGVAVGEKIADVAMRDLRGNVRSLLGVEGPARVVLFLGTECPISNVYLPGILEIEKAYREQGVVFYAVYPNAGEKVDDVARHAYERGIPFLVIKDHDGAQADALGIERVPTACVIDKDGVLRYRGRIDDQYGAGSRRPKPSRADLELAIKQVLAGEEVTVAETPADGCLIARSEKNNQPVGVTFAKDVATIIQHKCEECHRPGRIGPFTLSNYDDVVGHAEMVREVVSQRRMPPWHADPAIGHFRNDRRLTETEVTTISTWIDAGMPMGDEKDLPKPIEWAEGWEMGEPDVVLKMARPYTVPASGVVPYRYMVVPTGFTEDKWISMAEGRPGAPSVVHHIIAYIMSPETPDPFNGADGEMEVLTAWAPGDGPFMAAPGTALRVPARSTLLLEMHYTPNGVETDDQSMIGIKFADGPPERMVRANLLAKEEILIPAHDPHHQESLEYKFDQDSRILAFLPHMHWRGKHFEYVAEFPDGRSERILSVPRWDFNWQTGYWLTDPLKVPKGTVIKAISHWDNSKLNPANPNPDRDVSWGLQTWDEMMVGWMYYVHEEADAKSTLTKPAPKVLTSTLMFNLMDRNKNGWVAGEEIPADFRPLLDQIGMDLETGLDPVTYEFIYRIVLFSRDSGPDHEHHHQDGDRDGDRQAASPPKDSTAKR